MDKRDRTPFVSRDALEAVASPARLELLSALGEGAATTEELAARLGRSRQSLYYHLDLLERAGLVVVEPPSEGRRERRYRVRADRLMVGARRDSAEDRAYAMKAIRAILRLTAREATSAMLDPAIRVAGPVRELFGFRGKARLDAARLRRANELIDELEALFRDASGVTEEPLYALTLVLTPVREAGGAETNDEGGT